MTAHATFNPNYLSDQAIVQALADGEHAPVLQAYFGAALYAELCVLAQQAQNTRTDKHAPLVYLLPGLLGSKLGTRTAKGMEILWLDPLQLITGKLTQLAIGKRRSIRPLGMMLPAYLKLTLALQAAGFRVRCHAYDWRRSIVDLGKQLAEELLHEPTREVMLVAHSMGGLVARAALKHAASAKVTRVIQLGAPNQGSFAMTQVFRACYPTVRKLGAVDQLHDAEQLTQQLFRSFYSFYEMLPTATLSNINLLRAQYWPQDALQLPTQRFTYARRLPRYLAAADQRCHVIAGIARRTVCAVQQVNHEFVFTYNQEGDGTVPLQSAHWPGAQHWYVPEAHGQLPLNSLVNHAIVDLLRHATTSCLPNRYAPSSTATETCTEQELRRCLQGKVRWDQLPMNERRELLEPVISPIFAQHCA